MKILNTLIFAIVSCSVFTSINSDPPCKLIAHTWSETDGVHYCNTYPNGVRIGVYHVKIKKK